MIKFYNTLTRIKEEFIPLKEGEVGVYSCGPTVYNDAHIGNLSSFVFVDLMKRWLEYRGYKVRHVMNLTDVEDKILRNCDKTMPGLIKYTEHYIEIFLNDLERLNIKPADFYPKATDHVKEMVEMVKILLDKGYAYRQDGSVYFKISAFKDYGRLAGLEKQSLKVGARVDSDEYDKEDARDFVLWKGWKPEEDGEIFWETEIGKGRPGWHIECSAMSMKYLGETVDIHTGGVDLVFPHHQNEIAQSEAATGKTFVKYWLHREFLNINGGKMSKSAGTGVSLSALAPEGIDAAAFRYLTVSSHYRSPLNFTDKTMEAARNTVLNLRGAYSRLGSIEKDGENQLEDEIKKARQDFSEAMDDDLNSPIAMAAFFNFLSSVEKMMQAGELTKKSAEAARGFMKEIDSILGIEIDALAQRTLSQEEEDLIAAREEARSVKDWKRADEIRGELEKRGVVIEDTAEGVRWLFR
jgi:cysteinyl-tRNA synthetase